MEESTVVEKHIMVSMGFTDKKVPVGSHICQIYCDEEERSESLLKFILSGLQTRERTACFSEKTDEETLRNYLAKFNISYDERKESKAITLAGTKEVYFENNVFDPDRMLNTLSGFYHEAMDSGFPAARVIGEMDAEIQNIRGGDRLLEYEAGVSKLLKECPVTAVCQYDANAFDGATIMDILKVHPHIIVKGAVMHNPYFVSPKEINTGLK
jgi:hypothetical protein